MKKIMLVLAMLVIVLISCNKQTKKEKTRAKRKIKSVTNISIEVSVKEILIKLSNNSTNIFFNKALALADEKKKNSKDNYLDIFLEEFYKIADGTKLNNPSIFRNLALPYEIATTNNEILKENLQNKVDQCIKETREVLRIRIDQFGIAYPKIQRIGNSSRIQIELIGIIDTLRIRKLVTNRGNLQFWEVYDTNEMIDFLFKAHKKSLDLLENQARTNRFTTAEKSLFTFLSPCKRVKSPVIGYARVKDTGIINTFLRNKEIRALLPSKTKYVKFLWSYKSFSKKLSEDEIKRDVKNAEEIALYAMKSNYNDTPSMEGDIISDAKQGSETYGYRTEYSEVHMSMNAISTRAWAKMTEKNIGKAVALVLDNKVYTAPVVNSAITSGSTIISGGNMTENEAKDIATVLKARLPVSVKVIKLSFLKN